MAVRVELIGVRGAKDSPDPIDFIIDTGAAVTVLPPPVAEVRLGIKRARLQNINDWSSVETLSGIGGDSRFAVVPCRYIFMDETGSELTVLGDVRLAEVSPASDRLPCLLGRDVLQHFTLSVTPSRGEVFLTLVV